MHNSQTALPSNSPVPHPFLEFSENDTDQEKATKLKNFLIGLSKKPEIEKEQRSILKRAADAVREAAFGFTVKKIESKLADAFEEYFDGENYQFVELADLEDLTQIPAAQLLPVLDKQIAAGKVEIRNRRRWHEPGKHYNQMFRPKK